MKDFMMLFISASYEDLGLSPEQMQAQMGKWFAWGDKMGKAGILKGGEALTSQIKRVVGKDRTVTDVNATELKELIGGYYMVSAESFEDVVEIAQDYPDYEFGGTVEIREIMVFDR